MPHALNKPKRLKCATCFNYRTSTATRKICIVNGPSLMCDDCYATQMSQERFKRTGQKSIFGSIEQIKKQTERLVNGKTQEVEN